MQKGAGAKPACSSLAARGNTLRSAIAQSNLPLADATASIMGDMAGTVVTVIAVLTLMSLCHANLFQAPRVLLALSRDGWFHSSATSVTNAGALLPGLLISAAAMTVLAMTGTFEELFISIALLSTALDAFTFSAVLRLRRTERHLPRPYRAKATRGFPSSSCFTSFPSLSPPPGRIPHRPSGAAWHCPRACRRISGSNRSDKACRLDENGLRNALQDVGSASIEVLLR